MLEIGRPAAAKTGTTTDWRDNWTLGYTPDLTVGVWVGNADNTPMKGVSGISGAGPIWHDFMRTVLRERPPLAFTQPEGLVRVEVCADSGLLPMGAEEREEPRSRGGGLLLSSTPSPPRRCPSPVRSGATNGSSPARSRPRWTARTWRSRWMLAPGGRPTRRRRRNTSSRRRSGCCRRSTLRGRGRMRCRSWHRWGPRQETWGRGTRGARGCAAVSARGRWARSERAGELSSAPRLPLSSAQPHEPRSQPGLCAATLACRRARSRRRSRHCRERDGRGCLPITLLADDMPLAIVAAPDYTAWWPLTAGRHTFRAVTTRADGSRVESEPVTVWVE